jgi:hypothetical protein
MSKPHPNITPDLAEFIARQKVFFVSTAPLSVDGHVNLSPKGLDCLRVLSPTRVAYLDLTGSGNETAAHLLENGRITLMFCAFDGPPRILRLHGRGEVLLHDTPAFAQLRPLFPPYPGARQIIAIDITRTSTSCGFAVPLYEHVGDRDQLLKWSETKGDDGLTEYRQQKNLRSIDGLPTPLIPQ